MIKFGKCCSFAVLIGAVFALAGCSQLSEYFGDVIASNAEEEIQRSTEYRQYEQYRDEGLLDEKGLYLVPPQGDSDEPGDSKQGVAVTFAENSFLDCIYAVGEERTPIQSTSVLLAPGDSLYITEVSETNDISNRYTFSGFRIWAYDRNGNRSSKPYKEVSETEGLLLTVPEDYKGSGFSVEPVGSYKDCVITAEAYYMDNGRKNLLSGGSWTVNKKPFRGRASVSPFESFTVVYDYSDYKDLYYCSGSTPTCWYAREKLHTVAFNQTSSSEQITEFSVELHPYISLQVTNSGKNVFKSIKTGNITVEEKVLNQKTFSVSKLKVGDIITIRVAPGYAITSKDIKVGTAVRLGSNNDSDYEYTLEVPETNYDICIEVTERNSNATGTYQGYTLPNADITIVRANGLLLKEGEELPGDNEKVTFKISPHKGYYIEGFTDKVNFNFVEENIRFSKLSEAIDKMLKEHRAVRFISFTLVESEPAGTYTYRLDGTKVNGPILANVRIGQTLKVEFIANSGYSITHSWFGANAISDAWTWVGGTDSITASVEITPEMDGITIDKQFFGIVVERVG